VTSSRYLRPCALRLGFLVDDVLALDAAAPFSSDLRDRFPLLLAEGESTDELEGPALESREERLIGEGTSRLFGAAEVRSRGEGLSSGRAEVGRRGERLVAGRAGREARRISSPDSD
jgi:hypothetical protein